MSVSARISALELTHADPNALSELKANRLAVAIGSLVAGVNGVPPNGQLVFSEWLPSSDGGLITTIEVHTIGDGGDK
jgi:hypothetical protein